MRSLVFVLPFFFAMYYMLWNRQDLAFLNVYLPCFVFLPEYYSFRVPHFPPESAASWALLPLGLSLLFYPVPQMRLRRLDLWVTLFVLSLLVTELLREPSPKDGFVLFSSYFSQVFLAYAVGRRLIEPGLRLATLQRMILLFVLMTPFIVYEYVHRNPWIMMASHFHLDITSSVQTRNGRPRVQASFGHAILAGIVFFIVFMLNHYLTDLYQRDSSQLSPTVRWLERYHLPALLMVGFLWLTQSRGPMISGVAGYSILQIPRFRHRKIAGFTVVLLLVVGGSAAYSYLDKYTSGTDNGAMGEAQASALYRRDLVRNYTPLVEQGGWFGWGALNVPHVRGQESIDNAYLLLALQQGKLGYYLFLLIIAESLVSTAWNAFTFESRDSRVCLFVLFAALTGVFLSITAVFFGPGVSPMCFLLLGWCQSVRDDQKPEPKFYFKRSFV